MTNTTLLKKYKDRTPEETISLIKNFFTNLGYTVQVKNDEMSEAKTWSCGVVLFKNNNEIMRTCGKGTTQIFSHASGYAELYERFCNNCLNIRNSIFCKKLIELSQKKYGYSFHPNEKLLTFEEATEVFSVRNWFEKMTHGSTDFQKAICYALTDGQAIGEPYISLTNPEEKPYYDRRILNRVTGSGGMAAGNTVEEALNQGLSELCEHYVSEHFFNSDFDNYYAINLDAIDNPELQEKITAIRDSGSNLYIFDLGYNFNMPVVLSVLINKNQLTTHVNFGSFPVFDIAAERIITEIYQGIRNYNTFCGVQLPWKVINADTSLLEFQNALTGLNFFNENIFLKKLIIVDKPSDCFITNKDYTNKEINNYFIDLFKQHNWSIHYINHGLMKEMAAVHIFVPEIDYNYQRLLRVQNIPLMDIKFLIETILQSHKFVDVMLKDDNYTKIEESYLRFNNLVERSQDPRFDGSYIGSTLFSDWNNPLNANVVEDHLIFYLFSTDAFFVTKGATDTIFLPELKKIITIREYLEKGYNAFEVSAIFEKMFNVKLSQDDINRCYDCDYIFEKAYYNIVKKYYNSDEYTEIVESFIYKA